MFNLLIFSIKNDIFEGVEWGAVLYSFSPSNEIEE